MRPVSEAGHSAPSDGQTTHFVENQTRSTHALDPDARTPRGERAPSYQPGDRLGRYHVLERLDSGGMGDVYAAYDPRLDRRIAIKLWHAKGDDVAAARARKRLAREAQALGQLSHPNVVTIYDVGLAGDDIFIAMELIAGQTVGRWIRQRPSGTDSAATRAHPAKSGISGDSAPDTRPAPGDRTARKSGDDRAARSRRKPIERTWCDVLEVYIAAGRGLAAAHRCGIIHRDFKPDNVMLDSNGRVRVVDFGLATAVRDGESRRDDSSILYGSRAETDSDAGDRDHDPDRDALLDSTSHDSDCHGIPAQSSAIPVAIEDSFSGDLSAPLTVAGTIMGTPAYMAPEQHDSEPTDVRTDVFSFCAALYESLYRIRPFARGRLADVAARKRAGTLQPPPSGSDVPVWLHRVLVRGLSAEPGDRWQSMDAVLAALSRKPGTWRRRAVVAALAVAAVIVTTAGWMHGALDERDAVAGPLCQDASEEMMAVWNDGDRRAVDRAFIITGLSYASEQWDSAAATIDRYSADWVTMHNDACAATRVRGEQSTELLDRRMMCLHDRLRELDAVIGIWHEADEKVVKQAALTAMNLRAVADCADVPVLLSQTSGTYDPDAHDQAARDRTDDGESVPAGATARATDSEPGELNDDARVKQTIKELVARARAHELNSQHGAGLPLAERARDLVATIDAPSLRVEALTLLAVLQGHRSQLAESQKTAYEAYFSALAIDDDMAAVDTAFLIMYNFSFRHRDPDNGLLWARHAEALLDRYGQEPRKRRGRLLVNIGVGHHMKGEYSLARENYEKGLEIYRKVAMGKSRLTADALNNLGALNRRLGNYQRALEIYDRVLAMRTELFGQNSPAHTVVYGNMGTVLLNLERFDEALVKFHQATRTIEVVHGKESLDVAMMLENSALAHVGLGQYEQAHQDFDRARAIYEANLPADHIRLVSHRSTLGYALQREGRHAEALAVLEPVLERGEKELGNDHGDLVSVLLSIGRAHLDAGRPTRAVPVFERALAIAETKEVTAVMTARCRFGLAMALWDARRDRVRAVALARRAQATYARVLHGGVTLARMNAWLASHTP